MLYIFVLYSLDSLKLSFPFFLLFAMIPPIRKSLTPSSFFLLCVERNSGPSFNFPRSRFAFPLVRIDLLFSPSPPSTIFSYLFPAHRPSSLGEVDRMCSVIYGFESCLLSGWSNDRSIGSGATILPSPVSALPSTYRCHFRSHVSFFIFFFFFLFLFLFRRSVSREFDSTRFHII